MEASGCPRRAAACSVLCVLAITCPAPTAAAAALSPLRSLLSLLPGRSPQPQLPAPMRQLQSTRGGGSSGGYGSDEAGAGYGGGEPPPPGDTPAFADGDLRLVGRVDINGFATGALQLYHDGEFGAVCAKEFDAPDAAVACRQLGFDDGVVIRPLPDNVADEDIISLTQVGALLPDHAGAGLASAYPILANQWTALPDSCSQNYPSKLAVSDCSAKESETRGSIFGEGMVSRFAIAQRCCWRLTVSWWTGGPQHRRGSHGHAGIAPGSTHELVDAV
eukprot:jgi/Ulvmu1/980/UM103_0007.1